MCWINVTNLAVQWNINENHKWSDVVDMGMDEIVFFEDLLEMIHSRWVHWNFEELFIGIFIAFDVR